MSASRATQRPDFISGLLRGLSIPVDIDQRAAIHTLLTLNHDWTTRQLADAITAILARSPRQQERLARELANWLAPARPVASTAAAAPEAETAAPDAVSTKGPINPPETGPSVAAALREAVLRNRPYAISITMTTLLLALAAWFLVAASQMVQDHLPRSLGPGFPQVRSTLVWILVALALVLPLGYLCERVNATLPELFRRRRKARQAATRRYHLRPGNARFPIEAVAEAFTTRIFRGRATLAVARAVPSRPGPLDAPRLNPAESVRATATAGTVPTLRFQKHKETWPIFVLSDLDSGARAWSDVPLALRNALRDGGITASIGLWRGRPDRFQMEDGTILDSRAMARADAVLLFVSDGAMLGAFDEDSWHHDAGNAGPRREDARLFLQRLSAGGNAIWLDERETRFWHPGEPQFNVPGLSAWPATAEGISRALRYLGGERIDPPRPPRRLVSAGNSTELPSVQAARVLGDAVGWAAACVMVQPISPGLAEALRAAFFPALPHLAFGRLCALHGSRVSQAGLSVGDRMEAYLRHQFRTRTPGPRRNAILARIRQEIEDTRPRVRDSRAEEAWKWYLARFVMDQDPDEAVELLLDLRGSALEPAIRANLARARLPYAPREEGAITIPLLRNPRNAASLARLSSAFDVRLAGSVVEPWRLLSPPPPNDGLVLPEPGVAVAISPGNGVIAALLSSGGIVVQSGAADGTMGPNASGSTPGPPRRSAPPIRQSGSGGTVENLFALSHDARFAASVADGYDLRVVDLSRPDHPDLQLTHLGSGQATGDSGLIRAVAWSPVSPWLAVASQGGLRLIGLQDAANPRVIMMETDEYLVAVTFAPNSPDLIITASAKGTVRVRPGRDSGEPGGSRTVKTDIERDDVTAIETGLDTIEAVACGAPKGPIVIAGGGRLIVPGPDGSTVVTWALPAGRVSAIELVDDNTSVAVLIEGELKIIHLATGVDLFISGKITGAAATGLHAALSVSSGNALVWAPDRLRIDVHGLARDLDDVQELAA